MIASNVRLAISVIAISSCSLSVSGQAFNVQSAADSYTNVVKHNMDHLKEFTNAKKYIDLAYENEQTSNDPKMWFYRGGIYLEIDRDQNPEVRNLDPDAIEKSSVSYINCIKTDKKKNFEESCYNQVWVTGVRLYNKGTAALNSKDFEKAMRYFGLTTEIFPYDKDNNLKRNTITPEIVHYYMARASIGLKDNAKAKEYLQKLIDARYNDPMIYIQMSRIYLEEKDTTRALTYVDQGRKIFDENTSLLNQEIFIYSQQGKIDELIVKFSDAININPDNEMLYYNRASLYDNKKDFANAESDYKKALDLKPEYLDANYSLGTLYFNRAADIIKASANLKGDDYEKVKKEYDKLFHDAAPYLEKAMDLNPKKTEDEKYLYRGTLSSLKQLYARTGEMDKYNKIKTLQDQQ